MGLFFIKLNIKLPCLEGHADDDIVSSLLYWELMQLIHNTYALIRFARNRSISTLGDKNQVMDMSIQFYSVR